MPVAPYWLPGSSTGLSAAAAAAPSSSEMLKPWIASTHTVMTAAPAMSRHALMICTQVVPFIPPTST